jgi:hypothetical protein
MKVLLVVKSPEHRTGAHIDRYEFKDKTIYNFVISNNGISIYEGLEPTIASNPNVTFPDPIWANRIAWYALGAVTSVQLVNE